MKKEMVSVKVSFLDGSSLTVLAESLLEGVKFVEPMFTPRKPIVLAELV